MSLNETRLSIVFTDSKAREEVQSWFELLSDSSADFNKKLAEFGIKKKFTFENPYLERMVGTENFLELDFNHDSNFRFPSALTKKMSDAILIVQTVIDDYNLGGKKSYVYQGETIKKDQVVECLDSIDSRVAMILASQLGVRLATKYFKVLKDVNEEFSGTLMFWYLIHYIEQYPVVHKILEKCDIKRLTSRGENALHYAAKTFGRCGDYDVKWLIEQGCDVNAVNSDGDTPLLIASRLGDKRNGAMRKLLHNGGDPNIRDKKGLTALHYHCATGHWLDMLSGFKQCHADFNADSPLGSPLWIANEAKRYEARQNLWSRNLVLSCPSSAYGENDFDNLVTATKHHDLIAMSRYAGIQLTESQAKELYCYACYYQCGTLFDYLQLLKTWHLVANARDTLFGREYILDHLDLLDDDHPAVGDSYRMFVAVIGQSTSEQVNELANTREFAVNCTRVIEYRSEQAIEFFQMLKEKSVKLDKVFFEKNIWIKWYDKKYPKDITNILLKLREMGVVFYESASHLKELGFKDDVVKHMCNL